MKIIVENLRSKIVTDNKELLEALREYYTFTKPGAYWSRGDGKKRFIHKNGYFRTGLLDRVIKDLNKIGCEPEIEYYYYSAPRFTGDLTKKLGKFTPYQFQVDTAKQALANNRGIVKSPTGSGKTLIMAMMLKAINFPKTLILFTQKQLVTQTFEFFKTVGIKDVGVCTGDGYLPGNIMLATVQSLEHIVEEFIDCECFMVDEAHEFSQSSDRELVINSFADAVWRYGFTATPPSDNIGLYRLEGAFGPILEVVTTSELIEDSKLTKPKITLFQMPKESSMWETRPYMEIYETFIINNGERNAKIALTVQEIQAKDPKAKIVILVKNIVHLEILNNLIRGSQTLQGADEIKDRYDKIGRFIEDGGVLIGTKILQTGVNIEEITHLFNARGLSKDIPTLQALGRALRKHESKKVVHVYDFLDTVRYLKAHSNKRKKHYEDEGHEVIVE